MLWIKVIYSSCENVRERALCWKGNIVFGNGLIPSGNKPLLGRMFSQIYIVLWHHYVKMGKLAVAWCHHMTTLISNNYYNGALIMIYRAIKMKNPEPDYN